LLQESDCPIYNLFSVNVSDILPKEFFVKANDDPVWVETDQDRIFMRRAIELAQRAEVLGEVPVGAVLVAGGQIIAEGWNLRESCQQSIFHAEMLAIMDACERRRAWRLSDCTLYVTLEPCVMCAGALSQSRIKQVVFGAIDPKGGATGSLFSIHQDARLNHRYPVFQSSLAEECSALLSQFFRKKRQNNS
jgi:tRNA(adenine34) deaminase